MSDLTSSSSQTQPLLEVNGLTKQFPIKGGIFGREVDRVHAVDGVTFHIERRRNIGHGG